MHTEKCILHFDSLIFWLVCSGLLVDSMLSVSNIEKDRVICMHISRSFFYTAFFLDIVHMYVYDSNWMLNIKNPVATKTLNAHTTND